MNPLLVSLAQLEAGRATGRVRVSGVPGGWVYVHDGLVYCAERADGPRLLDAMEQAGLFTPEERQMALSLPTRCKWRALVADDDGRLSELTLFARSFVARALATITPGARSCTFAPQVTHPFGPLAWWRAEVLVPGVAAATDDVSAGGELQELLEELSPHVHSVRRRLLV